MNTLTTAKLQLAACFAGETTKNNPSNHLITLVTT